MDISFIAYEILKVGLQTYNRNNLGTLLEPSVIKAMVKYYEHCSNSIVDTDLLPEVKQEINRAIVNLMLNEGQVTRL